MILRSQGSDPRVVRRACGRRQLGSDFVIGFRRESRFPDQCSSGVSRSETSGVPPLNLQRDGVCSGPQWTLDARAGIKIPSEFRSLELVVESTARNGAKRLKSSVADSKYGFECCCGQQRTLKWQGWRPAVKGTSRGAISTSRRRGTRSAGPATVTAPITRDGRSQMAAAAVSLHDTVGVAALGGNGLHRFQGFPEWLPLTCRDVLTSRRARWTPSPGRRSVIS